MKKIILTTALLLTTIFSYSQTNDDVYFNHKKDTIEIKKQKKSFINSIFDTLHIETDEEFIRRVNKEESLEELNDTTSKKNKINDDIWIETGWYGYSRYGYINSYNTGTVHYGTWKKCMNGYLVFMGIVTTYVVMVVVSN